MATAIDFAAMMAEEKRKMLRKAAEGDGAALESKVEPDRGNNLMAWQECADRPVRLSPERRFKLDLAQYEAAGDVLKVFDRLKSKGPLCASTDNQPPFDLL